MQKNRQFRLAKRPVGVVKTSDFDLVEHDLDALASGEARLSIRYIAMEPAMRGWMINKWDYIEDMNLGDVMRAFAVGEVVETNSTEFKLGDFYSGLFGWQEFCTVSESDEMLERVDTAWPITYAIGAFGITSMTAYFGVLVDAPPKEDEPYVVTGAAGAVGSIAVQVAKLHGAIVIGTAGSDSKCKWLTEELGIDYAINYREEDFESAIARICPTGIHTFYDNVGGPILDAALEHLQLHATILLCGGISTYNEGESGEKPPGPSNLFNICAKRAVVKGTMVMDHYNEWPEAKKALGEWLAQGKIKYQEDILDGFESCPNALLRLFSGENQGKQLVRCG